MPEQQNTKLISPKELLKLKEQVDLILRKAEELNEALQKEEESN